MADVSDVGQSIAAKIGLILYPSGGTGNAPAIGKKVKVVWGWPNKGDLDAWMGAGNAQVSVVSLPQSRNTTRGISFSDEFEGEPLPYTYTIAAVGQTVTIGGAAPSPYYVQNLGLIFPGVAITYQPTAGQTPAQIAAALASQVAGASVVGAVITLPDATLKAVRRGTSAVLDRSVRNQTETFQISVWAPTSELRDLITKTIDPQLADLTFLTLADESQGRIEFVSSNVIDNEELQGIFRRDLRYTVDYATFVSDALFEVVVTDLTVRDEHDNQIAHIVE